MVASLPGLRAGAQCSIEIEDRQIGDVERFSSRIEDLEEDRLYVDWPMKRGQLIDVATGTHVQVSVPTQTGATLFLDCEVARRVAETASNPIAMLAVRVLAVGRQEQRGHFRLNVAIQPVDCSIWERDLGSGGEDGAWRPVVASIIDISGGGVGLSIGHEVTEGMKLRLRFPYPMGDGDFVGDVRVRSVIHLSGAERTQYKVGTAFEDGVDRTRRERLARCIHRVQLEQKRRDQSQTGR
jgi:c-di-GMP-binding flagellar brake protein YcgR